MTTGRDLPPAIQWHEGMLLAPQHFQQLQQRGEALLQYHTAMQAPFHWGVRHLRIDPVMLIDGSFRVLELEAIMPDGLVVTSLEDESAELTVDLQPFADDMKQQALTIHLAVPASRRGLSPVKGELARFDSIEGDPVVDANTGDGELRIPRLKPRLRLLPTDDPPQKFVSFPLAKVAIREETFVLDEYVPPLLRVRPQAPSNKLHEACSQVATRMREKAVFLAEQVDAPEMAARAPQLLETKAMVNSLVASLPTFEAMVAAAVCHPFTLYLGLCSLVGQAASVGRGLVPPVLDPYDHNDIWATFERALAYVGQVLEEGISEAFTAFRFSLEDDLFQIKFEENWAGRKLILGVRSREGITEREVETWVAQCIICSSSLFPDLRDRRIPGAPRRRIEGEAELVPARGVTLFSLEADPEYVLGDETLQVRNLDDPSGRLRPLEIVLYVKNEA